eukprot:TRINITY_DN86323_c0_g1_i1.p1 TRINITY_DN86323_c0_g1~~TRINITY_DN86323_c0_g1_i1.p1  ORF type:complete len:125 (-),score=49.18 TRINITY_DN86323_c0_g1_i1:39-413(-)
MSASSQAWMAQSSDTAGARDAELTGIEEELQELKVATQNLQAIREEKSDLIRELQVREVKREVKDLKKKIRGLEETNTGLEKQLSAERQRASIMERDLEEKIRQLEEENTGLREQLSASQQSSS